MLQKKKKNIKKLCFNKLCCQYTGKACSTQVYVQKLSGDDHLRIQPFLMVITCTLWKRKVKIKIGGKWV